MDVIMTGLIYTKKDILFFRDDDHNSPRGYIAWSIYDTSHRPKSYRWPKLPKGFIEFFDGEKPPRTVRYVPGLLN